MAEGATIDEELDQLDELLERGLTEHALDMKGRIAIGIELNARLRRIPRPSLTPEQDERLLAVNLRALTEFFGFTEDEANRVVGVR